MFLHELHLTQYPKQLAFVIIRYLDTYPDLKITIEETVADQNKVAWKYFASGINKITKEKVTFEGIIIDRIDDGKIVHRVGVWNQLQAHSP